MKDTIQTKKDIFGEELPPYPYNLHPRITTVDGYMRFRYVRAYLGRCFSRVPHNLRGTPLEWRKWMAAVGMANGNRFLRRVREWLSLEIPVPLKFLELLGTDLEKLESVLGLDRTAYREALERAWRPRYFQYFFYNGIYPTVRLPEGITEPDAICCVQEFLGRDIVDYGGWRKTLVNPLAKPNNSMPAHIAYRDLKDVRVQRESHSITCYPPKIAVRNGLVYFDLHAPDEMIGRVKLPWIKRYWRYNFFRGWYNRGVAFGNSGRIREGLECFNHAIEMKKNEAAAWYCRGVALGELGRPEEADESFLQAEKVSKEKPGNQQARKSDQSI